MLNPGDVIDYRYRVSMVTGEGAYGTVYLVRDSMLNGKWLAVKEMVEADIPADERREAVELFAREAEIMKSLNHPGLPRVFENFTVGDRHYIVMEHIDGETLEEKLRNSHLPFTPEEVLPWGEELCLILVYLHTRMPEPVIFRDLKPSNIMIDANGRLKLIDFGIARRYSSRKAKDTYFMGTPGFSPPEQYGRGQSDCRSDIFAFGATLYRLLTKTDMEQYSVKLSPLSKLAPFIPKWLENVIMKCLAVNPGERYQSVLALQSDLQLRQFSGGKENAALSALMMMIPSGISKSAARIGHRMSPANPFDVLRNTVILSVMLMISLCCGLLLLFIDSVSNHDSMLKLYLLCCISACLPYSYYRRCAHKIALPVILSLLKEDNFREFLKITLSDFLFALPLFALIACVMIFFVSLYELSSPTSVLLIFCSIIAVIIYWKFCRGNRECFCILCLCLLLAVIVLVPNYFRAITQGALTPCKSSDKRYCYARSIKSLYYNDNLCDKCWKWNSSDECRGWNYKYNGGDHKYQGWNHPNLIPLLCPLSLGNLRTCDEASTMISASEAFTMPDYSILEIYIGGRWRYYKMKGEEITEISESLMKHQFWINGAGQVYKDPF